MKNHHHPKNLFIFYFSLIGLLLSCSSPSLGKSDTKGEEAFANAPRFECDLVHIEGILGPYTCREGASFSLWGLSLRKCKTSACASAEKAAVALITDRLRSAPAAPQGSTVYSKLRCFYLDRSKSSALCSIDRADGVIIGGGEDLACWLVKERLAYFSRRSRNIMNNRCHLI